jgi:hypothetical protein
VAYVERDHPRGAGLEQAVGEAAGGGADVEAVAAGDIDLQRIQRIRELDASARDVRRWLGDEQLGVVGDEVARPAGSGPVAPDPHPPGAHRLGRARARARQAALGQEGVDPSPRHVPDGTAVANLERETGCVIGLTHKSHIRSYLGSR